MVQCESIFVPSIQNTRLHNLTVQLLGIITTSENKVLYLCSALCKLNIEKKLNCELFILDQQNCTFWNSICGKLNLSKWILKNIVKQLSTLRLMFGIFHRIMSKKHLQLSNNTLIWNSLLLQINNHSFFFYKINFKFQNFQ